MHLLHSIRCVVKVIRFVRALIFIANSSAISATPKPVLIYEDTLWDVVTLKVIWQPVVTFAWFPILQWMHMLRISTVAAKVWADFCLLAASRPSHTPNPSALLQHTNHSSADMNQTGLNENPLFIKLPRLGCKHPQYNQFYMRWSLQALCTSFLLLCAQIPSPCVCVKADPPSPFLDASHVSASCQAD